MGCSCLRNKEGQISKPPPPPKGKISPKNAQASPKDLLKPGDSKTPSKASTPVNKQPTTRGSTSSSSHLVVPKKEGISRSGSLDLPTSSGASTARSTKSVSGSQSMSFDFDPHHSDYDSTKYYRTTGEHSGTRGKKRVTAAYRISSTHVILETSFK
mmetsp:Transcript_15735/g.28755  ORF Transcript_15735/g.28755 Transcript_15735/m.28755 type:complete len:156 (+) Transcript_15735:17-484(+)